MFIQGRIITSISLMICLLIYPFAAAAAQTDEGIAAQTGGQQARGSAVPLYVSPVALAAVQSKLQQQGYEIGQIDGKWGLATARAISAFQQEQGLQPTGHLNIETIEAMDMPQVLKGAVERTGLLQAEQLESSQGAQLYIGPEAVRQIQQKMEQEGHYTGQIDGIMGPATSRAIQAWEKASGYQPTGQVTLKLMDSLGLQDQFTAALVGVGQPEAVVQDRQLQIFDQQQPSQSDEQSANDMTAQQQTGNRQARGYYERGRQAKGGAPLHIDPASISQMQEELRRAGFDPGQADGIFGNQTRQALKKFQKARSLEPTGNLNITTARILMGGLGN